MKWKDKRDVLLISTQHTTETVDVQRYTGIIKKPKATMEYNEAKSSIDQSDQMSSYNSPLRKSLKWYRKLAVEFILGTTVVNSHIVYNQLANKRISITELREQLVRSLLTYEEKTNNENEPPQTQTPTRKSTQLHTFLRKEGNFDKIRKYCKGCYAKKIRGEIIKNRVKKVVTYCGTCDGQPHFCLQCFHTHAK